MSEMPEVEPLPEPCFRLQGRVGGRERSFLLTRSPVRVGSAPYAEVTLAQGGVSRFHALLALDGAGAWEVVDQDSKNGTFVNGRRVSRATLRAGDRLAVGPVELRLDSLHLDDLRLGIELWDDDFRDEDTEPTETATVPCSGSRARAEPLPELVFPEGYVVGRSIAMGELYCEMRSLAESDLPVLVIGETGVGKELLARTLHLSSPRRGGPFVAINCAAIPADLLEAELFGIGDRVATGVDGRRGELQRAAGGTLLLDEIGEMPPALQSKLLRVLEERRMRPLGGTPVKIDARILAATNADVETQMERGAFRRDLFYRLAGSVLAVPPLRERREDVQPLVESFVRRYCVKSGKRVRGVSVGALRLLVEADWPGNVRQLEHTVRRLVVLCPAGQAIESTLLLGRLAGAQNETPDPIPRPAIFAARAAAGDGDGRREPSPRSWSSLDLGELERLAIVEALRRSGENQMRAARLLGISRHSLSRRLKRYRIVLRSERG